MKVILSVAITAIVDVKESGDIVGIHNEGSPKMISQAICHNGGDPVALEPQAYVDYRNLALELVLRELHGEALKALDDLGEHVAKSNAGAKA